MPFAGELSALLTAFLWSGTALLLASASQSIGSFQVNITRLILAEVYLLLLIVVLHLDVHLTSSQILNLSISGVIGLSLGDTFLFKAFEEIGARISMLLMSLAPAIAALIAYFVLHEQISTMGIVGMAITVSGISIVVLERKPTHLRTESITVAGLIYALLGAVGQGVGLVFAKLAFQEGEVNGFVATAIRILASLLLLLPIGLLTKRFRNPIRMFSTQRRVYGLIAAGSVLGPFLGISFSLIAVEYTKVGIAATIMAIVPIIMLPLVRIFYKERLSWRAIGGAIIAVGGVAMLFMR
jgi:drug/metabolite transporter (DMT)-like permease